MYQPNLKVNVLCSDVGAYQKLNMRTLKDIISIHIQCFQEEGKKKFIFCLRDFDEQYENLEDLDATIRESMAEIWVQIPKPKSKTKLRSIDVYSIEVFPFRSFRTHPKTFNKDCVKLRNKLENFQGDYINNLPLDGFVEYLRSSWDIIKNNKDLNIPDQKKIVSNVRCKEEANVILDGAYERIDTLKNEIGTKKASFLAKEMHLLFNKSHKEYEENTVYYEKETKIENKNRMTRDFNIRAKEFLSLSFENEENIGISQIEIMVSKVKRQKEMGLEVLEMFHEKKQDLYILLNKHKKSMTIEGITSDELCKNKKLRILEKLKVSLGNLYVKITDNLMNKELVRIRKIQSEFSEFFSKDNFLNIISETQEAYYSLEKQLIKIQETDPILFSEINETFFDNIKTKLFGRMKDRLQGLNMISIIVRDFKNKFWRDKNKIKRNWKRVEIKSINKLYKQNRNYIFNQIQFLDEDMYINGELLVFGTQYLTIKGDVETEIENIYQKALDQHNAGNALQNVPKVFSFLFCII